MDNYVTFNIPQIRLYISKKLNIDSKKITNCNVHININNNKVNPNIDISIWRDRYKRASTEGYYFLLFKDYKKLNNVYHYNINAEHYIGYISKHKVSQINNKIDKKIGITINEYIIWNSVNDKILIKKSDNKSNNIEFDEFEISDMDRNFTLFTKGEIANLILNTPNSSTSWINKLINNKNNNS